MEKSIRRYKHTFISNLPPLTWAHLHRRLGYDIESYVMDYIVEKGLRLRSVPYLHIVANIDNRGFLNYF